VFLWCVVFRWYIALGSYHLFDIANHSHWQILFFVNFSIMFCHLDVDEGVKVEDSGWQNKPVAQFKYQC
jgi:hypothetical protein